MPLQSSIDPSTKNAASAIAPTSAIRGLRNTPSQLPVAVGDEPAPAWSGSETSSSELIIHRELIEHRGAFLIGPLLLVAGAFAVMLLRKPRDFLVLAMGVLALNVLVISGIAHALLSAGDFQEGSILLVAVVAAVSMGVSGAWLFRLQRSEDAQ